MPELACVARCNGAVVEEYYAYPSPDAAQAAQPQSTDEKFSCRAPNEGVVTSPESFRALVRSTVSGQSSVVVVSYDRGSLGQTGTGHFSPVAAYHEGEDRCLVLDVARFKYPPYWVKIDALFGALLPLDTETKKPRGLLLLRKGKRHPHPEPPSCNGGACE